MIKSSIVKNIKSEELVLISLGPTATVLAFDLANQGIQAIDVGQLDNEYDWFSMHAETRKEIKGEFVAEFSYSQEKLFELRKFYEEIILKIGE